MYSMLRVRNPAQGKVAIFRFRVAMTAIRRVRKTHHLPRIAVHFTHPTKGHNLFFLCQQQYGACASQWLITTVHWGCKFHLDA